MERNKTAKATGISSAEFGDIIDRYSNPRRPGSPAAKIDGLLRDPMRSTEIIRAAITDRILAWQRLHPHEPLTAAYVHVVARDLKMELIFTRDLGIPATLYRAGLLYERSRGAMQNAGEDTRGREDDIWDEAILADRERQMTHCRSLRTLPLHDGTTSAERSTAKLSCGGRRDWEAKLHGAASHRYEGEIDEERSMGYTQALPDDWLPDAKWLTAHGITPDMADGLTDEQLSGAGIDPREFRAALGQSAPVETRRPRRPHRGNAVALVLQDADAAARLADMHPELSPDAALAREGMSVRLARTGLAFERLVRANPGADRQSLWDAACAQLNNKARPRGAKSGPDGYLEYLRAVTDVIARLTETVDA